MYTNKFLCVLFAAGFLGLAADATAASGPQHKAFRGLAMGNAHTAVVDDKDALYYNPAGLNLINALGNASSRPSLANYPRNRFNLRVNALGTALPVSDALAFYDLFQNHKSAFSGDLEDFIADSTLDRDMVQYHNKPIDMGLMHGSEFAMHNFGAAYWMDVTTAPYINVGILFPQAVGIQNTQVDAVIQVAMARGFLNNRLAAGVGYKLAYRQSITKFEVGTTEVAEDRKALLNRSLDSLNKYSSQFTDFTSYGHGIDLGALWQQTSWLRFGASLQNLGMYLNNEFVTPEFTVGAAVSPPILSTGGILARKVNFAVDLEDLLNDERNYKFLSKVNFGAEVEQYLWKFASVRIGGGFKGGYWSSGTGISLLSLVHIEAVTWAEEVGYYTGQAEDRFYAVRIGVGL